MVFVRSHYFPIMKPFINQRTTKNLNKPKENTQIMEIMYSMWLYVYQTAIFFDNNM